MKFVVHLFVLSFLVLFTDCHKEATPTCGCNSPDITTRDLNNQTGMLGSTAKGSGQQLFVISWINPDNSVYEYYIPCNFGSELQNILGTDTQIPVSFSGSAKVICPSEVPPSATASFSAIKLSYVLRK